MSYDDYELIIMEKNVTCSSCHKDLSKKLGCHIYFRDYCMECSKPMRDKIIDRKLAQKGITLLGGPKAEIKTRHQENHKGRNWFEEDDEEDKHKEWWKDSYYGKYKKKRESDKILTMEFPIYKKMLYYTRAAKGEISGLGRVEIVGKEARIIDAIIFRQKCTSGGTDLSSECMSQFVVSLINMGFNPENWKLWWHSHNDFGVFWSETDDNTIQKLSAESTLYSICINKKGETVGREDTQGEEAEIPIEVEHAGDPALKAQCEKEVAELVTNGEYNWKKWKKGNKYKQYSHNKHEKYNAWK